MINNKHQKSQDPPHMYISREKLIIKMIEGHGKDFMCLGLLTETNLGGY